MDALSLQPAGHPLRFSQAGYTRILTLTPAVTLTGKQQAVLNGIEAIAHGRNLNGLADRFNLLEQPEYRQLIHIQYRDKSKPEKEQLLARVRSHTPFTDLFLNLQAGSPQRRQLVDALTENSRRSPSREACRNSIEALTDLYFYALHPLGKAFRQSLAPWHLLTTLREQRYLLKQFDTLLTPGQAPVAASRLLLNELQFGLVDLARKGKTFTRHLAAYPIRTPLQTVLPDYPMPPRPPQALCDKLKTALASNDTATVETMITTGELAAVIPPWRRLMGPDNHQHGAQDFTLDTHHLKTLKAMHASPYYRILSPEEQFRVSSAALIHDIGKHAGSPNLREGRRIPADYHHPGRSAEIALEILPSLGYTVEQTRDIVKLIAYHQELGNLAKPDGDSPTPDRLKLTAQHLGSLSMLNMLKVLTEGDIRSVKRDEPGHTWFTPEVSTKLEEFSRTIGRLI